MLILTYLLHGVSQQTLVPDGVDTGGRAGWVELPMHLLHLNYNNVVDALLSRCSNLGINWATCLEKSHSTAAAKTIQLPRCKFASSYCHTAGEGGIQVRMTRFSPVPGNQRAIDG